MAITNGRLGLLSQDGGSNTIGGMRKWTTNDTTANPKGTPSNAGNAQVVLSGGNTDWTMTYDFYGRELPAEPGQFYDFVGWNGSERLTGNCLCESLNMTCEVENSSALISGSASFGGNGALTRGVSTTTPTVGTGSTLTTFGPMGCIVKWTPIISGTAGSEVTLPGLRNWGLNLACTSAPYVSSTAGNITKRTAGNYTGSASLSLYNDSHAYLAASATRLIPGTPGILKLYVSASLYYGLSYAVVNANGLGADVEGAGNNVSDISFDLSSYAEVPAGTLTRGAWVRPNGTDFWPLP